MFTESRNDGIHASPVFAIELTDADIELLANLLYAQRFLVPEVHQVITPPGTRASGLRLIRSEPFQSVEKAPAELLARLK